MTDSNFKYPISPRIVKRPAGMALNSPGCMPGRKVFLGGFPIIFMF